MQVTLYHIEHGPAVLQSVDVAHALSFPQEWSREPWSADAAAAWIERRMAEDAAKREAELEEAREKAIVEAMARLRVEAEMNAVRERVFSEAAAPEAPAKKK